MTKTREEIEPFYTQGTKITCPQCGKHIATVARDLFLGEQIDAAMFKGIESELVNGSLAACPDDGAIWLNQDNMSFQGTLHTSEGWK